MQHDIYIQSLLEAAQRAGILEAEAYYQQSESMRAMVKSGEIEEYAVNTSGGLSLRGLVNGRMGSAFTEALDEASINMLVCGVLDSARLITDEDEQFIFAGSPSYETVNCTGNLGSPEQRIDLALALESAGRTRDPRVLDLGFTGVETTRAAVRIVNTKGVNLSHVSDICVAFIDAIAREGEKTATNFLVKAASDLSAIDAKEVAGEAVDGAVFYLGASPCGSGEMSVIFRNNAMTEMLGTFCGVFSADAAQKGMSLLSGKEGETIAAPCVTIVDDPLRRGGFATRAFDDEGVATSSKNVVDGGVLTTLLHNLKTAKKANAQTTGNAARGGYAGAVTVAPSNFYIAPGEASLSEMEASMGNGLVVTDVAGLHSGASMVSGDFSLLAKGYLIENGVKASPVEQVTVAGNFFKMLKDAVSVGSDLKFPSGQFGSPSVRISKLSVAGK